MEGGPRCNSDIEGGIEASESSSTMVERVEIEGEEEFIDIIDGDGEEGIVRGVLIVCDWWE